MGQIKMNKEAKKTIKTDLKELNINISVYDIRKVFRGNGIKLENNIDGDLLVKINENLDSIKTSIINKAISGEL